MQIPVLVDISYWWWALIAACVWGLSGFKIVQLLADNEIGTERFWLILGINLGWFGSMDNKIWFGLHRQLGYPEWMPQHFFVLIYSLAVIVGAALHIRTFTKHKYGEWPWMLCAVATFAGALLIPILFA